MPTELELWRALVEFGQAQNVNMVFFAGGHLQDPTDFLVQRNVLYDLAGPERLDGLIVFGGALANYTGIAGLRDLCARYRPLPMINLSTTLEGVTTVMSDNYQGVRSVMSHLIEAHGYCRIAHLAGPTSHVEAQIRYRAYCDALEAYGIPFDPQLVIEGDFYHAAGEQAIATLFDERKVEVEALFSANDHMLIGTLPALRARGIRVPYDLALVGYDDSPEVAVLTPPFTTVRQPWYEIGYRAAELLLAQVRGEILPAEVLLPTHLVVRQSCGCIPYSVRDATAAAGIAAPILAEPASLEEFVTAQRPRLLAQLRAALVDALTLKVDWAAQLLDAFVAAAAGGPARAFLAVWDVLLQEYTVGGGDVAVWHSVLSTLRREVLPALHEHQILLRVEDLFQQARTFLSEGVGRMQAFVRMKTSTEAAVLQQVGQTLITAFEMTQLMDAITRTLPVLNIGACYVAAYENPAAPTAAARLFLAYNEQGRIALPPDGLVYPARQLAPEALLPTNAPYALVVEPLYFQQSPLGFVLFQGAPGAAGLYDMLGAQLSSAFKGALLVAQVADRAQQIQTASEVARAAASILDLDVLIQQVVELVRERFNLYYAGLFLVDAANDWAILRSGTGVAGQMMLVAGHKLAVAGDSMIGWCILHKQARISLNVGEESVRFNNPYLPETQSEMALPLIVRDKVIGALTIQSTRQYAFSEQDITVLETMASQVATALENVRLLRTTQMTLRRTELLYQASQSLITTEDPARALQRLVDLAAQALSADRVLLVTFEVERRRVLEYIRGGPSGASLPDLSFDELENGLTGWVIRERQPALSPKGAPDLREGAVALQRRAATAGGAVLVAPLLYHGEILGTLTAINRPEESDFTAEDMDLSMVLANQAAAALANARLLAQTRTALRDMEAIQRRYQTQAWKQYLNVADVVGYEASARSLTPLGDQVLPEVQRAVTQQQAVVLRGDAVAGAEGTAVVAPGIMRGQVVGAVGVHDTDPAREWTEEEIALVEAIAERMAITADNLRLLDATQRRAARERLAREITDKMRQAASMESLIELAVREVAAAFGSSEAFVQLQSPEIQESETV